MTGPVGHRPLTTNGTGGQSPNTARVPVTLAINDYDHVRDLVSGAVGVEGVTLTCIQLPVEEIFFRFTRFREWDVSELSLAKYASLRAAGDESLVAIPVFTSRAFRHSAIFVRADGPVDRPTALVGGRIGVPEWTQTATVYARAALEHEFGVPLRSVTWVQGGTNEPGRVEGVAVTLPDGVSVTAMPDDTLNDLLIAGEIDAVIAAHPPTDFKRGTGRIVRLFSDYQAVEESSFRGTGVFPIMHVVVMRRDLYEQHRWMAMNLVKAFEDAKRRSHERMLDVNTPWLPFAWAPAAAQRARSLVGADPWPYGIAFNHRTLDAFLGYAFEQGVCARRLSVEELFVPEVQEQFTI